MEQKTTLPFLSSPLLETIPFLKHGFFTRQGGVSPAPFASLNVGFGKGDAEENVAANRRLVAAHLGISPPHLLFLKQTHSTIIHTVNLDATSIPSLEGDAFITQSPGLGLAVNTADCVPCFLVDPQIPLIAAVHAGWKGAHGHIIAKTLERMEELGASVGRIQAAIGPCIHQENYEIDTTFYELFCHHHDGASSFFRPITPSSANQPKWLFDLPGFVERQLKERGVGAISSSPANTYQEESQFFSCRRSTHEALLRAPNTPVQFGVQASAICLKKL